MRRHLTERRVTSLKSNFTLHGHRGYITVKRQARRFLTTGVFMATSEPSASAFALPLPSWQQPTSVRVARYEPKKRKKGYDDWDNDVGDAGDETTDGISEAIPAASSLILSPEEAHQYHVAGLSFDQELPGGRFPHAAPKDELSRRETKGEILKGLSTLSPPVYPPQSAAYQGNLRLQHFAVLSAILHRCLLERDYLRAGRVWGLILREEYGGNPIDVRNEGRWGIGAEILLRRGRQLSDIASASEKLDDEYPKPNAFPYVCFTREGFEDAKQYYERLIIQHPYRKAAPDAISALHFYPAMFGLWIYVTQEESNAARDSLQLHHREDSSNELSDEEGFDSHGTSGKKKQKMAAEIRKRELEHAQQIAARMDEVIVSPPYSDSPELLELRGMLSLWIADLFVLCVPQPEREYQYLDPEYSDAAPADDLPGSIQERREQRLAMEKRQAEISKSIGYFEKGKHRSRGVSHTLENLHIDDEGYSYMS